MKRSAPTDISYEEKLIAVLGATEGYMKSHASTYIVFDGIFEQSLNGPDPANPNYDTIFLPPLCSSSGINLIKSKN